MFPLFLHSFLSFHLLRSNMTLVSARYVFLETFPPISYATAVFWFVYAWGKNKSTATATSSN